MARRHDPELEQRRRQQVLKCTFDLLCERPYAEVKLDDVAKNAGVSKGLVTYYYPTKDALLVAAIADYHEQQQTMLTALLEAATKAGVSPTDILAQLVRASFLDKETLARELRFQLEVWSYAKRRPEVQAVVASSYQSFRRACEALFEEGRRQGLVAVSDLEGAYQLIHALIDGLSIQVVLDDSLDLEAVRKRAVRAVLAIAQGMAEEPAAS